MTGWFFQSLNVWNEGGTNELGRHFGTVPPSRWIFRSLHGFLFQNGPGRALSANGFKRLPWCCRSPRKWDAMDEKPHENPHWHLESLEKGHHWCSEEFWPYVVLFERRDQGSKISKQSNPIPWMSNTPRKHSLVGFFIHIWDYIVMEVLKILGEWDHLMILNADSLEVGFQPTRLARGHMPARKSDSTRNGKRMPLVWTTTSSLVKVITNDACIIYSSGHPSKSKTRTGFPSCDSLQQCLFATMYLQSAPISFPFLVVHTSIAQMRGGHCRRSQHDITGHAKGW